MTATSVPASSADVELALLRGGGGIGEGGAEHGGGVDGRRAAGGEEHDPADAASASAAVLGAAPGLSGRRRAGSARTADAGTLAGRRSSAWAALARELAKLAIGAVAVGRPAAAAVDRERATGGHHHRRRLDHDRASGAAPSAAVVRSPLAAAPAGVDAAPDDD